MAVNFLETFDGGILDPGRWRDPVAGADPAWLPDVDNGIAQFGAHGLVSYVRTVETGAFRPGAVVSFRVSFNEQYPNVFWLLRDTDSGNEVAVRSNSGGFFTASYQFGALSGQSTRYIEDLTYLGAGMHVWVRFACEIRNGVPTAVISYRSDSEPWVEWLSSAGSGASTVWPKAYLHFAGSGFGLDTVYAYLLNIGPGLKVLTPTGWKTYGTDPVKPLMVRTPTGWETWS